MADEKLEVLAQRLQACREKGNRVALQNILESARILREAQREAGDGFAVWLRDQGHMDPSTARRYLRVADFVEEHRASMSVFATIGVVKLYALASLPPEVVPGVLDGSIPFSAPLEEIPDVRFRTEVREMSPRGVTKKDAYHAYLRMCGYLVKARGGMQAARRFKSRFTAAERKRIREYVDGIVRELAWLLEAA